MENLSMVFLVICLFGWGWFALYLHPFWRNIISIGMSLLGVLLLLITREWKLNGILISVAIFASIIAEKFPKSMERHRKRRERVTSLQDLLFFNGTFMTFLGIYELLIIIQYR